ncbi:hypothetical protein J1N35_039924 [Gossypium stocksii]|uniref:DUF4283 domain-containing protein n=1 Tax=Gossypium stocksii TaxID=47602 RepID=A0A9D3UCS2_9ROSI|nr:hypothetical protein J1N35_039924 [Gossypium stocksii]
MSTVNSAAAISSALNGLNGQPRKCETRIRRRSLQKSCLRTTLGKCHSKKSANVGGIAGGVDEGLENDDFEILERDVKVSLDGPYPEIFFSDRVQEILDRNMEQTPMGSSQVIDIDNDYYLVKFVVNQDYTKALTEGPCVVYGNYLTVQPWSRDFFTKEKHPLKIVVWMRLPGLPYKFYNKKLLRLIVGTLGKVVKINYNTTVCHGGGFDETIESICGIDGTSFCVEHERLPSICYKCRCYGHRQDECSSIVEDRVEERPTASDSQLTPPSGEKLAADQNSFGPWMQAPGHKVRKRVEHKWPSKPVLAEWVESLSKELDNASRGLGLENNFEVHMEVMEMENGDAGIDSMSERPVGEEPSNQIVIVEHDGVDVRAVGGLLARQ